MGKDKERTAYEELAKGFESNATFGHMHSYDLYRKWLEAVWTFLNAGFDKQVFKDCLDQYTYEQGAEFGRLLGVYTDVVEEMPFRDTLGELFMRLDVKSVASGQFFTPHHIAEMMARMQFSREDFEQTVKEKGEVSVCDPAVGSGVMLLAFSRVVHDECGRNALRHLKLYGTDIDERCVLMTRIQLRMNGLDTFGRMAGMLGNISQVEKTSHALPSATSSESNVDTINAPELPDLSNAVILHRDEGMSSERVMAEQLALF